MQTFLNTNPTPGSLSIYFLSLSFAFPKLVFCLSHPTCDLCLVSSTLVGWVIHAVAWISPLFLLSHDPGLCGFVAFSLFHYWLTCGSALSSLANMAPAANRHFHTSLPFLLGRQVTLNFCAYGMFLFNLLYNYEIFFSNWSHHHSS